jgi:hypothetical protein
MFDLDARIDLDKVMSSLLINQEFGGSCIPVIDALRELDRITPNRLADLFREMRRRGDLDHFLMPALNGAIALKQVHDIAHRVSNNLDLDVTGTFEETLNEYSPVAKRRLGLGNRTLKRVLKLGLFAHNTHTTASTTHSGLDDH